MKTPPIHTEATLQNFIQARGEELIDAWQLAQEVLLLLPDQRGEWSRALGGDLPTRGRRRQPVTAWAEEVRAWARSRNVPLLDAALFVLALGQIEAALGEWMKKVGLEEYLIRLVGIPLESDSPPHSVLQTQQAQQLSVEDKRTGQPPLEDAEEQVLSRIDYPVFHSDRPTVQDHLFRKGYARAWALWLRRIWEQDNSLPASATTDQWPQKSFMVHLDGPWGSGKTSLLLQLERQLAACPVRIGGGHRSWLVVWFNGWRHRHLQPVWWPLWNRTYRSLLAHQAGWRKWMFWIKEWWWRLRVNGFFRTPVVIGLFALGLIGLGVVLLSNVAPTQALATLSEQAGSILAFLGLAGSIGSAALNMLRALFSGQAAERFVRVGADPMEQIRRHFCDMVTFVKRPILVCIDDLDRCQPNYVVGLLEHIQTLFSHAAVQYVVAADRRWLYECFEQEYAAFKHCIREPGRPTGYLFLEKIFQMGLVVPSMNDFQRQVFLEILYGQGDSVSTDELEQLAARVEAEFEGVTSTEALITQLEKVPDQANMLIQQLRRQAAVQQLARQEVHTSIEHFLMPFASLLEPNPRAIKRLVNAYSVGLALALLSDESVLADVMRRKRFALWTILQLRWPLLANYLREAPETIDQWRDAQQVQPSWPEEVRVLLADKEVQRVLNGEADEVDVTLTTDSVCLFDTIG